jgi:hypothetical protein
MTTIEFIYYSLLVTIVFSVLSICLYIRDCYWAKRAGCKPKLVYRVMIIISAVLVSLYILGFVLLMFLLMTGMAGM